MTRAVCDRILKDENGDNISDHLRNHVHLTNCIHLKNHMHKHSPMSGEQSLIRDLIVLQRSRSLRDPSASPSSWRHSPSVIGFSSKRGGTDGIQEGRRSLGVERPGDGRRLSASSPPFCLTNFAMSKVAPGEASLVNEGSVGISDRSSKSGLKDGRKVGREKSSLRSSRTDILEEIKEPREYQEGHGLERDVVSGTSASKDRRSKQKGKQAQDNQAKTLSEKLHSIPIDSDDVASSNVNARPSRVDKTGIYDYSGRLNREKRRNFRGARRTRGTSTSREVGGQNELSVASNSYGQGSVHQNYCMERDRKNHRGRENVSKAPRNGCGIPWNWSSIHHKGRTILDMAGRSLSCTLSDSRSRKGGATSHGRGIHATPVASDYSSSSTKSDAEALPLLVEASGSQNSAENAGWVHDYSGELGIFADKLLENNGDSDLAFGEQHKLVKNQRGRHQNLTEKYTPRIFRDLVGQNLVAQALSNAVMRRKVGLLYVFYGPHGTGKTSCARIFARALNCQSTEHQKPCGFCNSCISHDMGKSRNIREIGPVSNFDFESIMDLLDNITASHLPSQYRVFILDDCDSMSADCWNAISKVIDRAPRRVVFVLVSSSLDVLPHIIISRCQKFFFPKLKEADIIYRLQWIASKERIDIDKDALKLISSRSDGSLRDAEMTLEQLSLLGKRISVPLVQELVGLISDEKLVDLLDLALSADTANTVKNLREIMETGVEPLALMSQLATVITDILAGSHDFTRGHKRKFFRRHPLSKEEMEKLRQALKTLSEAEKQLRMTNEKLTWLTAAMLQLAPDQQYALPDSSAETSFNQSPLDVGGTSIARKGGELVEIPENSRGMSTSRNGKQNVTKSRNAIEEIWLEVLEKIQHSNIKEFLSKEANLVSVSFGAAPTVQLMFGSPLSKSKVERFREHIVQAFESVLGSPVTVEIRYEAKKDAAAPKNASSQLITDSASNDQNRMHRLLQSKSLEGRKSEIVEVREPSQRQSIARSNMSLAHVIQQAEGCSQRERWTKRKAVSIAERLEQENLRLESKSRNLLCWKASKATPRKLSRLKTRARRSNSLLKFVSCGKCLSSKSPR